MVAERGNETNLVGRDSTAGIIEAGKLRSVHFRPVGEAVSNEENIARVTTANSIV